jgi:uncharacterized protein (DUF1684 family)
MMKTPKRKITVRCTNNTWCTAELTIGKEYKLVKIGHGALQSYYRVRNDQGELSTYYAGRFVEVKIK